MGKQCFFIGHRDAPFCIKQKLKETIEDAITKQEINDFIVGHYGNFDRMAAASVIKLKEKYPTIRLFRLLPYHPAERVVDIPDGFDGTYYPEGQELVPKRFAIVNANRVAINDCNLLIAYSPFPGNSRDFVSYARKKGVQVRQVTDDDSCSESKTYSETLGASE